MAPNLPEAADIPWQVDLYYVGNTSPGIIKVVAFGPKLLNRLAKVYNVTNSQTGNVSLNNPIIINKIVKAVNPIIYIVFLPHLSTNNTVNQ